MQLHANAAVSLIKRRQLVERVLERGWTIHISSPSTALVAQARSCSGLGKTTAFAIIQASTGTACVHLRVHTGTTTSGVVPHRLHALQGLECRSKTFRFSRALVPGIPQL